MKKKIIIPVIFILISTVILNAHKPNVAHFKFQKNEKNIEVIAELPWTFRLALIKEFPYLKNNESDEEFEVAIFAYFRSNIKINGNGQILKLSEVSELEQEHSFSVSYKLIFQSHKHFDKLKIVNTCLFELSSNQKNENIYVSTDNVELNITTDKLNSGFHINNLQ